MIPTSILRQKTKVTQNKTNPVPPNATRTRFNNEYYSDEISEHRQDQPTPATISNLNNLNQNINNDFTAQNAGINNMKVAKRGKDKKSMTVIKHIISSLKK